VREGSESFFYGVLFFKFDVEGGGFSVFGRDRLFAGTLLPFKYTCPVLALFLVEFVFPFGFGFFTIFAIVAALVAA
jgi:hypothetical protein